MAGKLRRHLSPRTEPLGWAAGIAALAAVITGLRAHHHIPAETWYSAVGFVLAIVIRFVTTPVADPRDSEGNQLGVITTGPGEKIPAPGP